MFRSCVFCSLQSNPSPLAMFPSSLFSLIPPLTLYYPCSASQFIVFAIGLFATFRVFCLHRNAFHGENSVGYFSILFTGLLMYFYEIRVIRLVFSFIY